MNDLSARMISHIHEHKGGKGIDSAGETRLRDFKKVAKEMESLFTYQLLKVMREASEGLSSESKGLGYGTYMGLFDMELSRLLAERGTGIQDALVQWFQRMPQAADKTTGMSLKNNRIEPIRDSGSVK